MLLAGVAQAGGAVPTALAAAADDRPGQVGQVPKPDRDLDSALTAIADAADVGLPRALDSARLLGLEVERGRVRVELKSGQGSPPLSGRLVEAAGGEVVVSYRGLIDALVPPARLRELAASSAIRSITRPDESDPAAVAGQGPAVTGALAWKAGALDGSGVKVGILDAGFGGYTQRQAAGDLPSSVTTANFGCSNFFDEAHGTAVAEIVHEMAPGARLYLICSFGTAGLGQAKNYAKAQGIRIVNHSVLHFNQGRGDGSGGPATTDGIVQDAKQSGILWVNAAGNYAQHHWSGNFSDTDADDFHNYTSTDQGNRLALGGGARGCVSLKWDDWPTSDQDFDLFLRRVSDNAQVASSTDSQNGNDPPTEGFCYTNPGATATFYIAIKSFGDTGAPRFDLFAFGGFGSLEYQTAAGSIAEPATAPETMAAGAVCWQTKGLEPYSSRGPTIDGRIKPDIAGLARVSSATYGPYAGSCGGGFAGTSAAAPHVAGAAALLRQDRPGLGPGGLQSALEAQVVDLAPAGNDNFFGTGWLSLARPDMLIRKGSGGSYRGDDVYSRDGSRQTRRARIRPGRTVRFALLLENDAANSKAYRLRAPKRSQWFRIRYFNGGQNVTSSVQGAGTPFQLLAPGETELFSLRVKARSGSAGHRVKVLAEGLGAGGVLDAVLARVRAKG